ncbi:S8 family serine peptidase [Winogradskyella vidalii]|uniref:S8 family serine peptidase n=1 Tax=Winogradskyella vidalii TaxID=2615024 RepID=UPI0015C8F6B3|nr:S8 family serine peptidase [Winogradskyella vidalii]
MKKLYFTTILCFVVYNCFAQAEISKERFQSLPQAEKELYLRVKKSDSLKTIRINKFLSNNSNVSKIEKDKNGAVFVITDVINDKPVYTTTYNSNAAIHTGTNHLQVGGSLGLDLDGSGLVVGVWDGGPVQNTHVEFEDETGTFSRVTNIELVGTDGNNGYDEHATHVTGTIAAKGVSAPAKGMATNVAVRSYNFNNDTPEMVTALADSNFPMILSNHSYGVPIYRNDSQVSASWQMGSYSFGAAEVDDIASTYPEYLIVASAGNSGTESYDGGLYTGYDKLTGNKNSKNNLVIANASPSVHPFTNEISFVINASSSQGPTDDLRIKPDIAGDGTALTSPIPNDTYGVSTGTSMSAPNVTGSLVLLQQYYNQLHGSYMKSATLKGLVCHTATDDEIYIGPDPIFGWGLLNAKLSAEVITKDNNGLSVLEELTLDNGSVYSFSFLAQAGEKLSATICWTDIPGVATTGTQDLNNPTPRLVNDLDLRITKDDGQIFLPWKLDYDSGTGFLNSKADNIVDNIERIDIDVPESGNYTIQVSHKGTLQASAPFQPLNQDFSLIITGNNLTLGTNDDVLASSLVVFPNPNKGEFTIRFDSDLNNNQDVKVDIYDIRGRSVYQNTFISDNVQFNQTINLNDVASGVYIANISKGSTVTSHKIIIE